MKRYIVEYADNTVFLEGGVIDHFKTKKFAEKVANSVVEEKYQKLKDSHEYSNLLFTKNAIYTNSSAREMMCLYVVTVREIEIPE